MHFSEKSEANTPFFSQNVVYAPSSCTFWIRHCVGLSGVPLTWFASYLSRRTQTVIKTGSATSKPTGLTCGVPQGSVLGPSPEPLYSSVPWSLSIQMLIWMLSLFPFLLYKTER